MDHLSDEAKRLYDLAITNSLSLPVVFSTLKRIQADAFTAGLKKASGPMAQISDDIDRRMAALQGDAGYELRE